MAVLRLAGWALAAVLLAAAPGHAADSTVAVVDRDRDGLSDGDERARGTSDLDRDSDDDGLGDGLEVGMFACMIAPTHRCLMPQGPILGDPRRFDTDRDGLSDGVEHGLRRGELDPPGPVRGTARARFRPDRDTDRDGADDGREDRNRNGRRDRGERDPLSGRRSSSA